MLWVVMGLALVVVVVACAFGLVLLKPWVRAVLSGAPVPLFAILGMRLRGTPPILVIDAYIQLHMRGGDLRLAEVETTYIAHKQRVRTASDLVDLVEQQHARREPQRAP